MTSSGYVLKNGVRYAWYVDVAACGRNKKRVVRVVNLNTGEYTYHAHPLESTGTLNLPTYLPTPTVHQPTTTTTSNGNEGVRGSWDGAWPEGEPCRSCGHWYCPGLFQRCWCGCEPE